MEHIRKAFDAVAAEYDAQREHVIPDMRNYYSAAVWAAESPSHTPAILDIGAGTGLLTALLLEKYPAGERHPARYRGEDACRRTGALLRPGECLFPAGDYAQVDLGGPYDLACSALSIHHLDPGDKRRLFGRVYRALVPGGIFVNADQTEGETPYFTERYREYWNDFLKSGPLTLRRADRDPDAPGHAGQE